MIPVRIRPGFWIFAGLLSLAMSEGNMVLLALWVVILIVSVFFHELGHAVTARCFGLSPRIELVAMGGLTYYEAPPSGRPSFGRQFLITLAGPIFGFILALVAFAILKLIEPQEGIFRYFLESMKNVNLIWTVVNLFPILPLDGGQLLRIGMEKWLHFRGVRVAFAISMGLSLLLGLTGFLLSNLFAGVIFFLFAFDNLEAFRKSRGMRSSDERGDVRRLLEQAEVALRAGSKEEALRLFEEVRALAKEGMVYTLASQYAAFLYTEQGKIELAYQELLPLREDLQVEGLTLLHRLAFDQGNFSLVIDLAGTIFQAFPDPEIALRTAYAAAALHLPTSVVGWLESARDCGVENLAEIAKGAVFDPVRETPDFQGFLKGLA
jgi:Zn-dependent protease